MNKYLHLSGYPRLNGVHHLLKTIAVIDLNIIITEGKLLNILIYDIEHVKECIEIAELLYNELKIDLSYNDDIQNPLYVACVIKNIEFVKWLVEKDAKLGSKSLKCIQDKETQLSPLAVTCKYLNIDIFNILTGYKFIFNRRTLLTSISAALNAYERNDKRQEIIVAELIKIIGREINTEMYGLEPLFFTAVKQNVSINIIKMLVDAGVETDADNGVNIYGEIVDLASTNHPCEAGHDMTVYTNMELGYLESM